ncbi:uncharacterized protein LOC126975705 [Leptidea sinapis]|uniref:uncharacterized protein LOC126975705 n=1 Tax=Leptidea sinapis TaxID=189913 RepID=UPI0021C403BB|nr:uncharacterized protein LOC126975705 [Leptidea sinapis]
MTGKQLSWGCWGNHDETPIRSNACWSSSNTQESNVTKRSHKRQALGSPTSPSVPSTAMLEEVRNIVNEVFEKEMSNLMANINKTITLTVSTCLKSIDSKIEELQRSVSFISSQYDDIKKEIDKYSDIFEKQRLENESLQSTVTDLTNKINLMEQQARSNNIEIQCVPESKNENLISITKQLSKTV